MYLDTAVAAGGTIFCGCLCGIFLISNEKKVAIFEGVCCGINMVGLVLSFFI